MSKKKWTHADYLNKPGLTANALLFRSCIDKGIMEPYEITSFNDLIPGLYNIPEPAKHCPLVNLADIDFAIVPCLSCDRKRRRLGHGGGYYDRTLAKLTAPSAALCREQLLLDEVNL